MKHNLAGLNCKGRGKLERKQKEAEEKKHGTKRGSSSQQPAASTSKTPTMPHSTFGASTSQPPSQNCSRKKKTKWCCAGVALVLRCSTSAFGPAQCFAPVSGQVLASCAQAIEARFVAKTAELVAINKSIKFSIDCGLAPYGAILADILKLLADLNEVKLCYVSRRANEAAHGLAKYALRCDEDRYWMEDFPNCINEFIAKEATVLA
ncbi:hypothetical protein Dsin_016265 [Dipteronia sinensis]|uniref:RNase H type-1 domain-containing protein n=1 Tax=Dipteronia sinensis TaxID=43782 RepID=A0AAE0AD16_9ROSI|nr:hypothetical protein Dsin_016265 [Dipteronia sinensis]